jgi:hypothetical protein
VAEAIERGGEVPNVDALASAVGIAAVDDEGDSKPLGHSTPVHGR